MEKRQISEKVGTDSYFGRNAIETPAGVQLLQIDPIQLDLFVIDPEMKEQPKRPWLTMVFDTHSRVLTGCDFYLKKTQTPHELSGWLFDDYSERADSK